MPQDPPPPPTSGSQVAQNLHDAATAIRDGGVVLAPCESAYLLIASSDTAGGLAALAALRPGERSLPQAWLCPSTDRLLQASVDLPGLAKRLAKRLLPGPLVLAADMPEGALSRTRHDLRVGELAIDDGASLWVRVAAPSPAAELADRRGPTLATVEVHAQDGTLALDADAALNALSSRGLRPDVVLRAGDLQHRAGATAVRVSAHPPAGVSIIRAGAYEERFIRKHAMISILFVCTGNTCRSPMAVAIAEGLLAKRGIGSDRVRVSSAGVSAGTGSPASRETAEAVRSLGFSMGRHSSRPIHRSDIDDADVIFTMTGGHRASVLALAPGAADKVLTLDPDRADVADPIGAGQETYNQTAAQLCELIQRRLGELTL